MHGTEETKAVTPVVHADSQSSTPVTVYVRAIARGPQYSSFYSHIMCGFKFQINEITALHSIHRER